jgi:glucose/arabinose dehydrogenase
MKKTSWIVGILTVVGLVVLGYLVGGPALQGAWVALRQPKTPIATILPLATASSTHATGVASSPHFTVAPGFSFSLLAKDIPGARVLAQDELGNVWVSQTSVGSITRIDLKNGVAVGQEVVLSGLNKPHGLAFDPRQPTSLYIATEKELLQYTVYQKQSVPRKILDLPSGGRHTTRTLLFGHDGYLYVSIGSTCNVCHEKNPLVAGIYQVNVRAKQPVLMPFATGLRNAIFMTENPITHELIVTEMGRDYLGDTTPPDEINIVTKGGNYGWPVCYGKNIHDREFDDQPINPCREPFALPSFIDLPAHSAPLGLAYIPEGWSEAWAGNIMVALHGSWNSTQPVGYSVVRLIVDPEGRYYGSEDVVSGWLTENETLGRPVAVLADQSGEQMYISDDKAGAVYTLRPQF